MKFPRNMEFYRWTRKDMIAPPGRNTATISVFSCHIKDAEKTFRAETLILGEDPEEYLFVGTTSVINTMIEFERYA